MKYLLQHFRTEPWQHVDAVLGEIVDYFGSLAVTNEAEDAPQARHADLTVGRDQNVAGLHTPAQPVFVGES